jgi:hypothetical protein
MPEIPIHAVSDEFIYDALEKINRSYWKKGKPFSTKFTNKLTSLVGGK